MAKSGRTDTHVAVVMNHETMERAQFVGTKVEVEKQAAEQKKLWKGAETEVLIQTR